MKTVQKMSKLLNRRQKQKIAIIMFLLLIGGLLETLGVSMILPLISAVMDKEVFQSNPYVMQISQLLNIKDINQFIILIVVTLIAIFILKNLFLLMVAYVQARFVNRNRSIASKNLLSQYLHRPYEYYLNADSATILRTVYGDIDNVFNLLLQFMSLAADAIVSLCLGIFLLSVNFMMSVLLLGLLGLTTLFIAKYVKPLLNHVGEGSRMEQGMQYKWILQSVSGIKDVKVFYKENYFVNQYEKNANKYADYQIKNNVLIVAPRLLIETIAVAGILGYVGVSVKLGISMAALLPLITAFGVAAIKLLPSVSRINTYMANIMYFKSALDNIYDNVDMKLVEEQGRIDTELKNKTNPIVITLRDKIELKDITYAYPNTSVNIFDHAQMEIPMGKSVGVMGPSGAGKSTIIDVLLGLLQLQKGRIVSDGKNIFDNYGDWLSHIGYIPQNIYMLDDSIRSNIAFGIEDSLISDQRIWEVLKESQLEEFVNNLPDGLDTTIGERGVRISGGQRQRLGIARALYHNPELLVFDEATSALDTDTETAIMEAIDRLHGEKTLVIIAHRLRTIENCDMIYEVKNGKITLTSLKENENNANA